MLLMLHSIVRWLVLGGAIGATALAFSAFRGNPWTPLHKRVNLIFLIALDSQFLLGLLLWLQSELVQRARTDMGAAMRDPQLRFFTVEHGTYALLALGAMHVAFATAKRAGTDLSKHRNAFIGYAVSLALILAAVPWPFRVVGRALWP
jgi:hypothetical protein